MTWTWCLVWIRVWTLRIKKILINSTLDAELKLFFPWQIHSFIKLYFFYQSITALLLIFWNQPSSRWLPHVIILGLQISWYTSVNFTDMMLKFGMRLWCSQRLHKVITGWEDHLQYCQTKWSLLIIISPHKMEIYWYERWWRYSAQPQKSTCVYMLSLSCT